MRNRHPDDATPIPTDDTPSSTPGGGGNGSGNGGGRGGGGRGEDDGHDRHHRGRKHDGDHDRRRHRRHHDNNAIYDPANQNASSTSNGGAASSVNECERGYDNGLYTGANDARRGQTHDPQRSHFYKRGGRGLFSIGRSGIAKQDYRTCFLRGYEEGFQNYQKYFSGGSFHK